MLKQMFVEGNTVDVLINGDRIFSAMPGRVQRQPDHVDTEARKATVYSIESQL